MSPTRHLVMPQASQQEQLSALSTSPEAVLTRRGVLGRAVATGAGAALGAAWVPVTAAQDATPVSSDEASTIETVSGQALYTLPRDHRWHGSPFMEEQFGVNDPELPVGGPLARQLPLSGVD